MNYIKLFENFNRVNPTEYHLSESKKDTLTLAYICKVWKDVYNEDFKTEYSGIAKQIGKKEITRKDFFKMWDDTYGEDFKKNYSGVAKIF